MPSASQGQTMTPHPHVGRPTLLKSQSFQKRTSNS